MRRLCSLIGNSHVDRGDRLTVHWPETRSPGLSRTTDKAV